MWTLLVLAQTAPSGASATAILYWTLLFIFLTAIITAVATKWTRDKCLKFFHGYHITLERHRAQTNWGTVKVFSTGLEITYDHPYTDPLGRRKTSYLMYQQEVEQQFMALFRYHDELSSQDQLRRRRQIERTFNPGPAKRLWRTIRNFVNTLRDAFNQAIGAVVGQYQRMNPASAVLTAQAGSVTQIGQTLLGRFANAYEPLLEQYIGQPVIVDIADPINPNNASVQYAGYLADYTQQYLAIFNVDHTTAQEATVALPDVEQGEALPPLPGPPPPGAPAPVLPPPLKVEHNLAIRLDRRWFRLQNIGHEPMVVRRLERDGFEPLGLGVVIPPQGMMDLPARDAHGGRLFLEVVRCLDLVAARRWATVRYAGEMVERRGLVEEWKLDALPLVPLVPKLLRRGEEARVQESDAAPKP